MMPAASVIIRSFNEAEYIEDTLQALSAQKFEDFEILLVDSGSTDGTLEIAREYVDDIVFVDPRNFTFGYSLNVGCEAAAGEYLAFLSAHAIPTDDKWLGTMIEHLRDEDVAMTYTNQTGVESTKFSEDRLFDQLFPAERKYQQPPDYFANNASSAIKKSHWEEHKFDERLTGHEDIEWAKHFMEQGYTVVYEPDVGIYHIHDESWGQIYRRFEREAIADREIGVRISRERWKEYAAIPRDIVLDTLAAIRQNKFDRKTATNILKFRYYQHTGTAHGLQKERDLTEDRYEYFYPEANEEIRIEEPGKITVTNSSPPEVHPNDVLIDIDYAGITDRDLQPYFENGAEFPVVPGREYVGEVIDIGPNVDHLTVGDRVTGGSVFHCGLCSACDENRYAACENRTELGTTESDGAFRQLLSVPAPHVYKLPSDVPEKYAILSGPLALIVDALVRAESFFDTANGKIGVLGNGLLGELTHRYLDQQNHNWSPIEDVTNDSLLLSCELVILASTSQKQIHDVLARTSPGTVIVLLDIGRETLEIRPQDIEEKILITARREGESHFEDALALLADGDYTNVLNGTYSVEQFVDDPASIHSGEKMSLLEL